MIKLSVTLGRMKMNYPKVSTGSLGIIRSPVQVNKFHGCSHPNMPYHFNNLLSLLYNFLLQILGEVWNLCLRLMSRMVLLKIFEEL